jgi:hypothetical protein
MSSLSGSAKKLGLAIGGLFAFKKITDFVVDATRAFGEQERAEKKLESIMTKVNKATGTQIDAMKQQAKELQKVTTVGDEVTMALQAQLGTFALSSEAVMTLTENTLDLAVANKGVNLTQEDMINYGNLVGKVMAGQVGALSRYGVTLTEAQAKQLKLGNEMERASVLSEILQGNYGDLARDMKNTWEGNVQSFKNAWGDMKELLGEQLMPVLTELVKWGAETGIPSLIEGASRLKNAWDTNFAGIRQFVTVTAKVIKFAIDGWVQAIDFFIKKTKEAKAAFAAIDAKVGGLKNFTPSGIATNLEAVLTNQPVSAIEAKYKAKGGLIPAYAQNGAIFPSRGTDTIPAMLTPGELVLNKAQQENLAGQLGGDKVVFNMYNPNFRDEQNAESIISEITRRLQQANLGVA